VARQTVFNHFPRKEDFAFEWGIGNRQMLDDVMTSPEFLDLGATARLLMIVRTMAEVYETSAREARILLHAWVRAGGPVDEDPALLVRRFQTIIEAGQHSGEYHPHLNAETAATIVRAAYFDAVFRWIAAEPEDPATNLLASMVARLEVILTGLRMPPTTSLPYPSSDSASATPSSPRSARQHGRQLWASLVSRGLWLSEDDALRGAGEQDVAQLHRHDARCIADQLTAVEDHVVGVPVLALLTVDVGLKA
jgi:TetR/AcrR family transcriptional regulator, cholesterol catabolism regulator